MVSIKSRKWFNSVCRVGLYKVVLSFANFHNNYVTYLSIIKLNRTFHAFQRKCSSKIISLLSLDSGYAHFNLNLEISMVEISKLKHVIDFPSENCQRSLNLTLMQPLEKDDQVCSLLQRAW